MPGDSNASKDKQISAVEHGPHAREAGAIGIVILSVVGALGIWAVGSRRLI